MIESGKEINSSQESPPLSQDGYNCLLNMLAPSGTNVLHINNVEREKGTSSSQESLPLSQEGYSVLLNMLTPVTNVLQTRDNNMPEAEKEINTSQGGLPLSQEAVSLLNLLKPPVANNAFQAKDNMQNIGSTAEWPEESKTFMECIGNFINSEGPSSSVNIPQPRSSLIPTSDWPGNYDFRIIFNQQGPPHKKDIWRYSEKLNKIFVNKEVLCPFNFTTNATLPGDCIIRAMVVYTRPKDVKCVVTKCFDHSLLELQKRIFEAEHLIRSDSSLKTYVIDPETKHHSIILPYENPAVGQCFSTYLYKFMCYSSCGGGPNRRPMTLVFTLEQGDVVIGRCSVNLKVCACPVRDLESDEAPKRKIPTLRESQAIVEEEVESPSKKRPTDGSDPPAKKSKENKSRKFISEVVDIKHYNFLKEMDKCYRLGLAVKSLPPSVRNSIFQIILTSSSESEIESER